MCKEVSYVQELLSLGRFYWGDATFRVKDVDQNAWTDLNRNKLNTNYRGVCLL